jgi:small GTP-binding protein
MVDRGSKVVLVGDSGVGKTAIFRILQDQPFNENASETVGNACATIEVVLPDNSRSTITIWDTAGQERYRQMIPMYFRDAAFLIIVYDITSHLSFESVGAWANLAAECAPESCICFLIGNKSDLSDSREVSYDNGMDLKDGIRAAFFYEISAFSGDGIASIRHELGHALSLQNPVSIINEDDKPPVVVQPQSVNPRPGCC